MSAYREFKGDLITVLVVVFVCSLIADLFRWGYDSTDGDGRSGLGLHTDAMTGCQYLSAGGSGITPRLNAAGKQICDRKEPTHE